MHLDFYGVRVSVDGDDAATRSLGMHFAAFGSGVSEAPDVRIELRRGRATLPGQTRLEATQVLERGIVYNRGPLTWVDHHGLAMSHYDFSAERGEITAPDPNDLVELGYLMVHSRVGVLLEARGFARVHALGIVSGGRAALVLTPSGGGKSRLALGVLARTRASLLGDDMVLLDRSGNAYPFPHPIGVSSPDDTFGLGPAAAFVRRLHPPKWLLPLDSVENRIAREPAPVRLIALYRRVSAPPDRAVPIAKSQAARVLFRDLVIGLGLPQVLELVARHGARDLPGLVPIALRRSRIAATLLAKSRPVALEVNDADRAATILADELGRDYGGARSG